MFQLVDVLWKVRWSDSSLKKQTADWGANGGWKGNEHSSEIGGWEAILMPVQSFKLVWFRFNIFFFSLNISKSKPLNHWTMDTRLEGKWLLFCGKSSKLLLRLSKFWPEYILDGNVAQHSSILLPWNRNKIPPAGYKGNPMLKESSFRMQRC